MPSHLLKNSFTCAIAVLAMSSVITSCNRQDPNIPKVTKAVRAFNARFNAEQFEEIYSEADQKFRTSVTRDSFTSRLRGLRQTHGPIQRSGVNGIESLSRWQRLFPESKPTRFIGFYNHCTNGGFQALFEFDVTADDARLLEFSTDINEHNNKRRR